MPELAAAPAEDGRPAWDADGSCRVDILQRIGLDVPEGPYETVAGLVADLLGRIPAPGDRAELPGWRLSVRQVGPLPGRAGPARPDRRPPARPASASVSLRGGGRPMSVLQLLFAVLLVLANGFFVGAEFALVSVRRSQIEHRCGTGTGPAGHCTAWRTCRR